MVTGGIVDAFPIDLEVIVHKHVPHAGNLLPRHLGMLLLRRSGKTPTCFADNLDVPQEIGADQLVRIELGLRLRRGVSSTSAIDSRMSCKSSLSGLTMGWLLS